MRRLLFFVVLLTGCVAAHTRQVHEAFEQTSFEHVMFLAKHRLYVQEGMGLISVTSEETLPQMVFNERITGNSYRLSSIDNARKLALLVIDDCLSKINRQNCLQNAILNFPMQEQDLNITMNFYRTSEGSEPVPAPRISLISIEDGMLRYYCWNGPTGYELLGEEVILEVY